MFDKTIFIPETPDTKPGERSACRGVVIDNEGIIPLIYDSYMQYYKLPGGGIEGNEEKISAFRREIREETGCEIDEIKEVGKVIEKNSNWKQTSYCFIGKITNKGENHFTQKEIDRGFQLIWVKLKEALSLINNEKPKTEAGYIMKERESFILGEIVKLLN